MTTNDEYALRIANGEKLNAILDEVRSLGYALGVQDERAGLLQKSKSKTSGGGDENE